MEQDRNYPGAPPTGLLRPLSARSVMASLLLGRDPPRARPGDLVRWCGVFGIAPGTARVALHRMAARGEIERDRDAWRLAGRLAERRAQQQEALTPRLRAWRGEWRLGVLDPRRREGPGRAELRRALRAARFAPLRDGVWLRPDNLPGPLPPLLADAADWFTVRPGGDPRRLAERCFAAGRWSARAAALTGHLTGVIRQLDGGTGLPEAFVAGAAAMAHLRADPLLPPELLDDPAAGPALRHAYGEYRREFDRAAAAFFRST